ncbi:MAG: maleylpyruvate isomerase N-terminal domain-containing protein [Anaerolineae bacterium]
MTLAVAHENEASRRRLEAVVRSLSPEDLARSTSDGWTVAALLAHMAFHDRRHLVLLQRWKTKGVDYSPLDPDAINDAVKPFLLALEPGVAASLCLESAEAVDAEVETLSDELLGEIQASGSWFRPNRSLHRNAHLDEIEHLLRSGAGAAGD